VALEAFATRLLRSQQHKDAPLVSDPSAWVAFVESISATIQEHAATGEDKATLLEKVKSARHRPTTSRVGEAFRKFGASLSRDEDREVRGRNRVAHAALMSDPADRDVSRDHRRVRLVRELLVRLVALAVGYAGPIGGAIARPRSVPGESHWGSATAETGEMTPPELPRDPSAGQQVPD
jgi:hypothetical protein